MLKIVRLSKADEACRIVHERIRQHGGDPKDYEGPGMEECVRILLTEKPEWFARNPD